MTDHPETDQPEPDQSEAEPDWQRKRRLAEVFGDVLPDTTDDERDPAERSDPATERGDAWLKEQVPPHHGG
ncbi:MAG: hypothetical protein QOD98_397 [Nocardioidaceae bacterium]|nr:hypothetical protein [Nocardioidaceae bacterium]